MASSNFSAAAADAPDSFLEGWRGILPLGLSAVIGIFWFVHGREAWSQAGFLHLAFARFAGEQHQYGVQGRAVYGDGAPLWVLLLLVCHALLRPLTAGWWVAGQALTAIAAVFFLCGLYGFARTLFPASSLRTMFGGAASVVLVLVLSPYWGLAAFSGSEVLFAAGVACWGLALVAGPLGSPIRSGRLLAGCACAGLGPLLRPEMLFLSLCLGPLLFFRWVNTQIPFRQKLSAFVAGMLLAVGPGAGWLLYTVRVFGTGLPNTLRAGEAAPGASVFGEFLVGFGMGYPWLLAGVAGLGMWAGVRGSGRSELSGHAVRKALDPTGWVPFVWAALVALFYVATHTAVHAEEVMLTAPALTASIWALASRLWPRIARVGLPLAIAYGLVMSVLFTWPALGTDRTRTQVFAELAAAAGSLPQATVVALAPAGEVAFLAGHPVADLGGVLDPGALIFRWDAADDRRVWWAQEQGARYMVLDHAPEPGSVLVWSRDVPTSSGSLGRSRSFDRLMLWRLPPSPTLPAPTVLPDHVD